MKILFVVWDIIMEPLVIRLPLARLCLVLYSVFNEFVARMRFFGTKVFGILYWRTLRLSVRWACPGRQTRRLIALGDR